MQMILKSFKKTKWCELLFCCLTNSVKPKGLGPFDKLDIADFYKKIFF